MADLLHALRDHTPLPREFVAAYCGKCGTDVQNHIGPASAAAERAAAHYAGLAREAELLSALRQAVEHIEYWAAGAFRTAGQSQEDFEFAWRADELASWALWERLKIVAGLPLIEINEGPSP